MKKSALYTLILFFVCLHTYSQNHSFEETSVPGSIQPLAGKSSVSISKDYFKNGQQSLRWEWTQPEAVLRFTDQAIAESVNTLTKFNAGSGIKVWIFNESPTNHPLVFVFKDAAGIVQYTFQFFLNYTGWRAAWIAYSDMWTPSGEKTVWNPIHAMELVSPASNATGTLWIDRLEYSVSVDRQATPDAQIPENNRHLNRDLWHWGLLHRWEQFAHDLAVHQSITAAESTDVAIVYDNIKNALKKKSLTAADNNTLNRLITKFAISDDGKRGAPLMQKDNTAAGDVNFNELNNLLDLSARAWYMDSNEAAKNVFLKTIRYMLYQGFAYESGMGTNHHYGYDIRDIFGAIWWMEDVLRANELWNDARKTITYWSGLQESRQPYDLLRDEITDSWNTLILPRLACALMADTEQERCRDLKALARWVNGSLTYTPGTIGGIKIDGTIFHHGGHYPAYGVPGIAYLGKYTNSVNGTAFGLDKNAREVFKFALLSASRQCNLRDWGIGVAGRHPFNGFINKQGVLAYAYVAQAFSPTDGELAGEYLRLMDGLTSYTEDNNLKTLFGNAGITANDYPQGFFTYNYASQGIYRYKDKMISIKGFTKNIWGAEIYNTDNRYGRYQSYGSVQIIGTKNANGVVSETTSRYVEPGWDWNLNPGTTTIQLPSTLLNSPTLQDMLRQPETFAGSNSFDNGKYGMFAMKLGEPNKTNFTPSFKANKSVFCFDNKIICVGSAISNINTSYPTVTTLFQENLLSGQEPIEYNGTPIPDFPYLKNILKTEQQTVVLKDLLGYYFYIPAGQSLILEKKRQNSYENKLKTPTQGSFATAYLTHGKAPTDDSYEYALYFDPSQEQLSGMNQKKPDFEIVRKDKTIHVLQDMVSGVRGYAIFADYAEESDLYLLQCEKETMMMLRSNANQLKMSVCSPDLNIGDWVYTTPTESGEVTKNVLVRGRYKLTQANPSVTLNQEGENTRIIITCRHGIPVEFSMDTVTSSSKEEEASNVLIYSSGGELVVNSKNAGFINVYSLLGRELYAGEKKSGTVRMPLSENVIVKFTSNNQKFIQKIILKNTTK